MPTPYTVRHEDHHEEVHTNRFDSEEDARAFADGLYHEMVISIEPTKFAPAIVCEWCETTADETNADQYDDGWYHRTGECAKYAPGGECDPRHTHREREDVRIDD